MSQANQGELFEPMSADLADLLKHAPAEVLENSAAWPQAMSDMIDVVAAAYVRDGRPEEQARADGITAVAALAAWGGARQWYLPVGETLRAAILHQRLYSEWGPLSPRELAAKYKLSEQHVYNILKEQRTLHRRRMQPDLFEDGGKRGTPD